MKAAALILLFVFCSIECRKVVPTNKHANINFIDMEKGGVRQQPALVPPKQPVAAPAPPEASTIKPGPPPHAPN